MESQRTVETLQGPRARVLVTLFPLPGKPWSPPPRLRSNSRLFPQPAFHCSGEETAAKQLFARILLVLGAFQFRGCSYPVHFHLSSPIILP